MRLGRALLSISFCLFSSQMRSIISFRTTLCMRRGLVRSMKTKPDIITLQPRIPALDETANPLFVTNSLPLTSLIQLPELAAVVGRGFEKASLIQEQSYAHLLGGKPAILGAETGSGKTLAYFLPLLDRYVTKQMEQKQAALLAAAQAAPAPQGGSEAQETQEAAWVQQQDPLPGPVDVIKYGIIMAPTAPLCDQIMSMVSDIVTELRDKGLPVRISKHPAPASPCALTRSRSLDGHPEPEQSHQVPRQHGTTPFPGCLHAQDTL